MKGQIKDPNITQQTSDGYHTFEELYEHRLRLFSLVLKANQEIAFKTRLDDKGESYEGWFIAGLNTKEGQISYHMPNRFWKKLDIKEVESNSDYDGHNSADVLNRLDSLLLEKTD